MFKVATRYLSGVSVFYGDDISRRDTNGELAIFIGPAAKGPSIPVQLESVDNAIALYGTNNPLVKAIYEFNDGYLDAGKNQNMLFVAYRVGGVPASIATSYGFAAETTDAYDGIENDYFIYANNTSAETANVKIWDKNKLLVLDTAAGINTNHFTVTSTPTGNGTINSIYGVDIDADPIETPVTLAASVHGDITNPTGSPLTTLGITNVATTVVAVEAITLFPAAGTLKITEVTGANTVTVFADYTIPDAAAYTAKTFTLTKATGVTFTAAASISLVGSVLVKGDSQLDLSNRELYELMRNALQDVEVYTPDYIVPAGVTYNATDKFDKVYSKSTALKANTVADDTAILVDAAAEWPSTGTVDLYQGGTDHNYIKYSAKTVTGSDFTLTPVTPTFTVGALTTSQVLVPITGTNQAELLTAGYVKIATGIYHYTKVEGTNSITITTPGGIKVADIGAVSIKKVTGVATTASAIVTTTYTVKEAFELGIGFVKETDLGGTFGFTWSDTKLADYKLAHFGYLFANFCNTAAVGFSTPLCGMNVDLSVAEAGNFSREAIVAWIGKAPEMKVRVDNNEAVEAITKNGTGLMGEATMVGSVNYNRTYMSKPSEGVWADAAYGLLMTDEEAVDGHEIIDDYSNPVDLGKFLCVGAALMSFTNRAANTTYTDTCGIYALGMLAGKQKTDGLSYSKVGVNSNASVTVIVNRNLYNELAGAGYIVVTREKGLGWVINNANSAARGDSAYYLISTTRTIKYVVENKRSILSHFIGKPLNTYLIEAAKTAIADAFGKDVKLGYLATNPVWDIVPVRMAKAIGKMILTCKLNPALELVQVDIDSVVDRGQK